MIKSAFFSLSLYFTTSLIALASEKFNPDDLETKLTAVQAIQLPPQETFDETLADKNIPTLKEDCRSFMDTKCQIRETFDALFLCGICNKENPYRHYNLRVMTPKQLREELDGIKKKLILKKKTAHMREAVQANQEALEGAIKWHKDHRQFSADDEEEA